MSSLFSSKHHTFFDQSILFESPSQFNIYHHSRPPGFDQTSCFNGEYFPLNVKTKITQCVIKSNDALRIVSGCLLPTPTEYLPVLSGIQPAELRRQGATLSLANCSSLDPDHILHGHLQGSPDADGKRLKSRHPFVPSARKLLDSLSQMGTRVAQWTSTKWNMEYSERTSGLHAFIPRVSTGPLGMSLPRAAWVRLNRLRSGVGRFGSSMYKWGFAPFPNCECCLLYTSPSPRDA